MNAKKILAVFVLVFTLVALLASCDFNSKPQAEHEHEYASWEITTAPTEDAPGVAKGTCTCNDTTEIALPVLTDETVWASEVTVAPTHLAEGEKTYTSVYGTVTVAIAKTAEHAYGEWTVIALPTETETGSTERECACGDKDTGIIPVLTDETVWTAEITVAPSHLAEGEKVYTSVYGTVTVAIAKTTDHAYGAWTVTAAPTETAAGAAERECACGDKETSIVPVLTDATVWTAEVTVAPTHLTEGVMTYTSDVYGTFTASIAKTTDHTYGAWTMTAAPTETEAGAAERECACGDKETGVVPVLTDASVWAFEITAAPSHLAEGEKVYTSVYGTVTVVLAKTTDHAYGAWTITVASTATTEGAAERVCACGDVDTATMAPLTDTSVWTATVIEAPDYNKAGMASYASEYGTLEAAVAKLVAPYDGKTYSNLIFDGELEDSNKAVSAQDTWSGVTITLDANGFGYCQSYPYRGFTQITMVDAETGRINITIYDMDTDEDGNPVPNYDSYTVYPAYVDFATGIIVRARNSAFDYVVLYTPFESAPSYNSAAASSWNGNAMAITYTVNDTAYNVFCTAEAAYIGVNFVDMNGNAVAANTCYNAPYVYVKDAAGNAIASFGYNGQKQVSLDGYEGSYTNSENGDLFLSGFGTATFAGASGTYTVEGDNVNVYIKDENGNVIAYYLAVLGEGNTYTYSIPKVTVSFVTGGYAEQESLEFTKFVAQTLPTCTHSTMTFKGWYYDAACTQPVEATFVPTADVTLYASWKAKVVINLVGVADGDANVLYLGDGDVIGDFLPVYGLDLDNYRRFAAWYVDVNGNGELDAEDLPLDLETTISEYDTGATVIAKWDSIPVYYGTYYGVEIWNASYGNSGMKTLVIDENGNISGLKNGVIVSYDPETQVVQWKETSKPDEIKTFYFDAETGVIAGLFNSYNIGNDYYILSRYTEATAGKVNAHYGVKAPKAPGSTEYGWYAQFVNLSTKLGDSTTILLYNNHIYNNITMTTTTGEVLTPATVKDAKTVVAIDNNTGNIIVAVTSVGDSFAANNNTTALDAYYGNYTMGDETVILDGTGTIIYAGKTGTYTATDAGFDVYFAEGGVNNEYYFMTIDTATKTGTITKVMVNVTLDVDGKDVEVEQIGATNANIAITLPTLSHPTNVFRGWYVAGDETKTPVGDSYVPTADVTLVALWKTMYTLTVVYNDTVSENATFVYGEGEIATLDHPTYARHKFDGWYTTATFNEGTEWTDGSAITADVTIYAKWSEAPIYNLTYTVTEIERKNDGNLTDLYKFYTRTAAHFTIDPDGKSPKTSYPFATGDIAITDYDPTTGSLTFTCGTKSYRGYVDSVSGIMIVNYATGDADMQEFFFLNPFESTSIASKMSGSYWNGGSTACIIYTLDDGTSYTIFVHNNVVYFGVSFADAEGNAVAGADCYQTEMLYVSDAEGNLIAYFGYNGTTMCELDGNEGTYTGANGDLVVSGYGALTMNGMNGSYTANGDDTFSVYVYNADGTVNMYYVVTMDKANATYTAAPVSITINFVSDYDAAAPQSGFAYVPSALPTLAQTGFVFRGWYVQGDESETIVDINAFVAEADVTLVAKWDAMLSFTIVYGNTLDTVVDYYGAGDTPALVDPAYTNGMAFNGWFLDAECTVAYTASAITENTTVYAKWISAHPMYGSYTGSNVFGSSSTGSTNSGGSSTINIVIDENGNMTGKTTGQIRDYDPETGMFKIYPDESKYYLGIYDAATGIMIFNYSTGKDAMINDVYIYAPGSTFRCNSTDGSYWNGGKTKIGIINCDAGAISYFMFENRIYTNVTWTSDDGEVAAKDAYNASNLFVYDSEGNLLAYFAKESGKGLVHKLNDGMGGTFYTDAENNALVLDGYGAGKITNAACGLDNVAFTYTVAEDGADYDILLVMDKAYYEVTITDSTYTIEHIQYTITFVTGIEGFTVDSVYVEYKPNYRLPTDLAPVGYKFEGWYTTPDYTERVYWHEANADTTYYAKWSAVCTLSLVYGGDIETVNVAYSSGDTITMGATLSPDGTSLYLWYTDEACTQVFTSGTITGSMALYGAKIANVTYGSYNFVDKDGAMVSNNKGMGSSTASMTITMLGSYTVEYKCVVSTEGRWDKFTAKETVSGTTETTINEISGDKTETKTTTLAAGDSITFSYSKDSSGNSGSDCVTVTLTVTPNA